jgi:TRAP-type C4-dicarboxylate transport system permease small subunit
MSEDASFGGLEPFFEVVRRIILVCAGLAGAAILVMVGVTVTDIILRLFRAGIPGAYDIVRICGAVTIGCGLPYVTAVKGHIAIEFIYRSLSRRGRVVLDSAFRLVALGLFAFLAYQNVRHGLSLHASGLLMPTLKMPVFWIPLLISFDSVLVCFVIFYHLLHPGRQMIES